MLLHAIVGHARAGTDLLRNILAQNPAFTCATQTTPFAGLVASMSSAMSGSPDYKNIKISQGVSANRALIRGQVSAIEAMAAQLFGWKEGQTFIDKDRGWNYNYGLFRRLFPEGKMICCVRDIRDIVASIEKQHLRFAEFDEAINPESKTLLARVSLIMGEKGLVAANQRGVEELIRRAETCDAGSIYFFKYEEFVKHPKVEMFKLYEDLGLPYFEHDFDNVENVSTECDSMYWDKFPHNSSGPVEDRSGSHKTVLSEDIATQILARYPHYNRMFGYE